MSEFRSLWKASRTARKRATVKRRRKIAGDEREHKQASKKRDGYRCRFPRCGCRPLGLRIESSHGIHKGMGGDPRGTRSDEDNLVTLCSHRHKDGPVSIDKGTLRAKFLTSKNYNGPVVWQLKKTEMPCFPAAIWQLGVVSGCSTWLELARESAPGALEPLTDLQAALLRELAKMEL